MKLFKEAVKAGNIILVIEHLPSFIASAFAIGTDVVEIMNPFLSLSDIQVIATANPTEYHNIIQTNPILAQRFDEVMVEEPQMNEVVKILENMAPSLERTHGIFFTYPAIEEMAIGADRYITTGVMPDKAVDLLSSIAPLAKQRNKKIIKKSDVIDLIEKKTGIPLGEVKDEEREKLLNLEEILHSRVIGQEHAVKAVAGTMKRARAGVRNVEKPIGSFLFVGPTGVGKTEVAKALAWAFFKNEESMIRFDMSEYQSSDSLNRLIGSFGENKSGVLSNALRERSYGVLLLDEFEKAAPDVHNLFLQILDEGYFSDMLGKKVVARNLIIIATSNAGSDLIWEHTKGGQDTSGLKDILIERIIKDGIFRPELLNRFDDVVVFESLDRQSLRKIGELKLLKLKRGLRNKG
jgi:ATP-dependent Clp protease ATP-binding subunit ClpC